MTGGNGGAVPARVMLVRSWTHPIAPLRDALRSVGLAPRFIRIDIEPALVAALGRRGFDVIVHDPNTRGIPRSLLDNLIRDLHLTVPVLELREGDSLAELAARVLALVRSSRH